MTPFTRTPARIYRLNTHLVFSGRDVRQAAVAPAVAPALRAACPEIEAAARLFIDRDPVTVGAGDRKFTEKRVLLHGAGILRRLFLPPRSRGIGGRRFPNRIRWF